MPKVTQIVMVESSSSQSEPAYSLSFIVSISTVRWTILGRLIRSIDGRGICIPSW